MVKLILIICLCTLIIQVHSLNYTISVALANGQFQDINGILRIKIRNAVNYQTQTVYKWRSLLKPNSLHTISTSNKYRVEDLTEIRFAWNTYIYVPIQKSIYLKHIQIIPEYIENSQEKNDKTIKACPILSNQKIEKNEELKLIRC